MRCTTPGRPWWNRCSGRADSNRPVRVPLCDVIENAWGKTMGIWCPVRWLVDVGLRTI